MTDQPTVKAANAGRIRFWSTPQSAADGQVTVLAILETIIAMAIVGYISWTMQSLVYIAVPACIAPLLLLRTEDSTQLCLRLFERQDEVFGWVVELFEPTAVRLALVVVVLPLMGVVATLLKVYSTLISFIHSPSTAVGAIPRNWRRIVLATDSHHVPEIVPGMEQCQREDRFRASSIFRGLSSELQRPNDAEEWFRILALPLVCATVVIAFLPSILYRWSLKSTSFVYFPFIWCATKSRRGDSSAEERLEDIRDEPLERVVRRNYAYFALVVLTILPFIAAVALQRPIQVLQEAFNVRLIDYLLFTGTVKLWHVGRSVNALITIGLFIWAFRKLRAIERGRSVSDDGVHKVLGFWLFVRSFIGIALAIKLLHIVVTSVDWTNVNWSLKVW